MDKKINVYLMYFIVFLQGFVFYGPIATIYRQARGLSLYDMFIIESISWILMIVFEIPWGWFADRFGYKRTIVISNFIFFISKVVFFKASSFEMFLLERIFLSLALSGLSGCDAALLYSSVNGEESEKVFGRYNAFSTGGFLIASFLTTFMISSPIDKESIDRTGFLTIIPYCIAFLASLFIKETGKSKEEKPRLMESIKAALSNRAIIYLVLSVSLAREVFQSVTVFLNQAQYIRSGIDIKYFGILLVLIQLVRLCSTKAFVLSEKFGRFTSMKILYVVITLSCILLIYTASPLLSVVCMIFISASMSLIEPMALKIENMAISTSDRAALLSVYAMIGDISAAAVNPVIGKTADISIKAAFMACVGICILMMVLILLYKKHKFINVNLKYI